MSVLKYFLGIVFLIIGLVVILLEEPFYGIGLLLMGSVLMPFTSQLLTKFSPTIFSTRVKTALGIGLGLIILITLSTVGRKEYDKVEKIGEEELGKLSIHPIKKALVNDLDYYYIEQGEGETIVLLHGFPDMANTWDETISALSQTHRVVAPFLRGYYPTGIPDDNDFSVKTIAEDIVALMDQLAVDQFTVIGQDWGASIGFSVTNLVDERVQKFVSVAIPHPSCLALTPALAYAGRHFFLLGTSDYGVRYTRKNNFAYIDRLYQRWSPDYKNYQTSSNAIKETFKFPNRTEAATGYYRSFSADQKIPELQAFYQKVPATPVLFLVGENDLIYTEAVIKAMKGIMSKGSETVVFENAGHFLHREVFDQFLAVLSEFLNLSNEG